MAIITKNKTTTGAGTDPLAVGELAVNTADLNLYVGTAGGNELLIDSDAAQIADGTIEGQVLRWDDTGVEWVATANISLDSVGRVRGYGSAGAANPAYSFDNDTDTGIYRSAVDTLAFTTAGVAGLRQNATQDVGIGVTPTQKLDVAGNIRLRSGYQVFADPTGGVGAPGYAFNSDVNTGMYQKSAGAIGFSSNGTEAMYIGSDSITRVTFTGNNDRVAGTASEAGANTINRFVTLTQLEYEGLTPNANTLYIIV